MEWLIRKTKCYQNLFSTLCEQRERNNKLNCLYKEQHELTVEKIQEVEKLAKELSQNKTIARQIIRLTNKTFQDKDTKNQIKQLCNKIIKGGK